MSCIMFLVIANKNLFLFSKCRASVLFCTPVSSACRHQVEAEDRGKVGASSWAGTRAAGEAKREVFPPKGSWRAVNLEEPTPGQRCHKMVKPSVQPPLPASWTSATLADSISSVFDTFCYFSWPINLGRVLVGCVLELELVNKGHCVLTAEWVPTAHLHCGSGSDLIHL